MQSFTKTELEVMRVLWQHGEMKPNEMQAHFPRDVSGSTLRFYLAELVEKGHVTRRADGKAYVYQAVTRKDSALREKLRNLIDVFCDGSEVALMAHLIRSEKLSPESIEMLRRMLEEETEEGPP